MYLLILFIQFIELSIASLIFILRKYSLVKLISLELSSLTIFPLGDLSRRINEINDNGKFIILVCETGGSSPSAGETLKKEGYKDIYILRGGINQWKMDNLPLV